MVSVTRSEFDALNAKVDQVLELVMNITATYVEESAGFSRNLREIREGIEASREEARQRFDQLNAKIEALTQAHGELRRAFDRHAEHTSS